MKDKWTLFPIGLGMALLILLFASWSAIAEKTPSASDFITEYSIPAANGKPLRLTIESAGPPARIWFTMPEIDAIGNLIVTSTVNYTFNQYSVGAGREPYDLVYDPNAKAIWFTQRSGNQIGRLDVLTKNISDFVVSPPDSKPTGIALAPNGSVWFTQSDANAVSRFNPTTSTFDPYPYTAGSTPTEIAVLNNDTIWFTAPGVNQAVKLTPGISNPFQHVPVQILGQPLLVPNGLALDNSGPWVSVPERSMIGRHAPGTLSFWRWYDLPTPGNPTALFYRNAAGHNQLWFVETANGRAGRLIVDENGNQKSFLQQPLSSPDSKPTDIVVDASGQVWIAANGSGKIVQWTPPYFHFVYLPVVQRP